MQNIQQIITRVLADGEVSESTINSELMVRREGLRDIRRTVKLYNLDMILAVGYRVSTPQAVMFRQWATTILNEYLTKGFALDDERLKNPGSEPDYFDEVLERIRAIRASEKRFCQKVRDLFAASSADYDKDSPVARDFFATVQNKLFLVRGDGPDGRRVGPGADSRIVVHVRPDGVAAPPSDEGRRCHRQELSC